MATNCALYKLIKLQYASETYLQLNLPPHIQRAITQIRVSAHNLEIERGRMARPHPIPPDQRLCRHCGQVETEIHFITECLLYSNMRKQMLSACPVMFKNFSGADLFMKLFTSTNRIVLHELGIFICRAMARRQSYLG